jgi:trigger factor
VAASGGDPRSVKLDWKKVRESQRERATKDVKASLLLERIADREAIEVMHDEVDREVQRIARQDREPVAAVRRRLEEQGVLRRIASRIRTEKTLNFLFEHARKVAED